MDRLRSIPCSSLALCFTGASAQADDNLLGVILGYTDLPLESTHAADPQRDRLQRIANAANKAATLTRQLLAFSRKQVLEPTDLGALVRGLEKMLPRLLGEDIDLKVASVPDLGKVKADAGQIEQAIVNLAVNARDAMPDGGHLTIETTNVELDDEYAQRHEEMKPGPYVMLSVSDSGCGMTPETQRRIFEPFFTTKEVGKGTGLGLSTVYGVVKQSNRHPSVSSELGQGTTFRIYLPRVDGAADVTACQHVDEEAPRSSGTILLAEDDAALRHIAQELLEAAGYTVLAASGGAEALAIATEHPVDLLLTDVVMPGMSGPDLARRLTERQPGAKVLFMSGYTDEAIGHHGVLSPDTLLLAKPFTAATLGRKVREAPARRQWARAESSATGGWSAARRVSVSSEARNGVSSASRPDCNRGTNFTPCICAPGVHKCKICLRVLDTALIRRALAIDSR